MTRDSTLDITAAGAELFADDEWFDPLEAEVRSRIRSFIKALLEAELEAVLSRGRYERGAGDVAAVGHRHGHRERSLLGTFGSARVKVPRARLVEPAGGTVEWRNATIPAYQHGTTVPLGAAPGKFRN